MSKSRYSVVGAALSKASVFLLSMLPVFGQEDREPPPVTGTAAADTGRGSNQLSFIENKGQWPIDASFVGRLPQMLLRADPDALSIQLFARVNDPSRGALVRLAFEGLSPSVVVEGEALLPGRFNYFLGDDPTHWQSNVGAYRRIWYRDLYNGVDLCLHEEDGGYKYDLVVAPHADLCQFVVRVEGARAMCVDAAGNLVIQTEVGELVQAPGPSFEILCSGEKKEVSASYRLLGHNTFGFEVALRDSDLPLVIDPGLTWATYLGSGGPTGIGDQATAVASTAEGDVIVTGEANWNDFPTTPGAYVVPGLINTQVFVSKLSASSGQLVYSSLFGGAGVSRAYAIAVDGQGQATVAGTTQANNFPTTPGAFDQVKQSPSSAGFVTRLSAQGDQLVYSTYIEGSMNGSEAYALALAPSGAAVVGGRTSASDFPTTPGAYDTQQNGLSADAFVSRLDPTGSSLEWSTLIGGGETDEVHALAVDAQGVVTAAGITTSPNFPTTPGAFQTVYLGSPSIGRNCFVTRFNAQGSALLWSSFVGGTVDEVPVAMCLDASNGVVIVGETSSFDFPTTPGAYQRRHDLVLTQPYDGFVLHLSSDGASLIASTYLGGAYADGAAGVAIDPSGVMTVSGYATTGFPVTPGAFNVVPVGQEMFVARLSPTAGKLYYSSFLGGPAFDSGSGLVTTAEGRVTIVGATQGGFPVTEGAFDTTYNGGQLDAVVATLDLVLQGIRIFGVSTPACNGPIMANAVQMPVAGQARFGLYCSAAPPLANGWLLVGTGSPNAVVSQGASIWLDPQQPIRRIPVTTNAEGFVETPMSLVGTTAGLEFSCQFIFENSSSCGGASTFSASNAVKVRVQ